MNDQNKQKRLYIKISVKAYLLSYSNLNFY